MASVGNAMMTGVSLVALPLVAIASVTASVPRQSNSTSKNVNPPANPESPWRFRLGARFTHISLGRAVRDAYRQIDGLLEGGTTEVKLLAFQPSFQMETAGGVNRTATQWVPEITASVDYGWGRHVLSAELGFFAVSLRTIDVDQPMVLTQGACSESTTCTMARLGFVTPSSGQGSYQAQLTLDETMVLFEPAMHYVYQALRTRYGVLGAGGGVGLLVMSQRRRLRFQANQRSPVSGSGQARSIGFDTVSQATYDVGAMVRAFVSFDSPPTRLGTVYARVGANYGRVALSRRLQGGGQVALGGPDVAVSIPITDLSVDGNAFKARETTPLELGGGFVQVGLMF